MKVLILGGCGFIGAHVVSCLKKSDCFNVVIDVEAKPTISDSNCVYIQGDFASIDLIEEIIVRFGITHVIHLVSTTLPKSSNENIAYDISSNVINTVGLLDLCVKHSCKKIIFLSSGGTVYGIPNYLPVDENHPNNPICSYGISKLAIEKYLFLYHRLYGLSYVCLRAANPYGPGQSPFKGQGIIANLIHKSHTGEPLEVWGDGGSVRDYFYIDDLARIIRLALFSDATGIFNAGSGVGLSINQLIEMVREISGQPLDVVYKQHRMIDIPNIILNCSFAFDKFGWHATKEIKEGIKEYLIWYRLQNFKK